MSQGSSEGIHLRHQLKIRRRNQNQIFLHRRKLQFLDLRGELVFLFGLFTGGNGFAETAWMFAVKCLDHSIAEGTGLKVVREHGSPSNGLQQRPMQTERGCQQHDEKNFAGTNQHECKVIRFCSVASNNWPPQHLPTPFTKNDRLCG